MDENRKQKRKRSSYNKLVFDEGNQFTNQQIDMNERK